jgi:hypothetical protein
MLYVISSINHSHSRYNSRDHPVPFHKAQDLGKVPKKIATDTVPDLEEAFVKLLSHFSRKMLTFL